MTCNDIESGGIAEKYVQGQLSEQESVAYETHFFECPDCLASLQVLQSAQAELRKAPRVLVRPRSHWPLWGAAAAALIVVNGIVWVLSRPAPPVTVVEKSQPVTSYQADSFAPLAKVEPPVYRETVTRGVPEASQAPFRTAMKLYAKADYAAALPALQSASQAEPSAPGPLFYLGICQLMRARTAEASGTLARVTALGDSPYLEPARFYRAKAFLRLGEIDAALEELKAVAALKGDLELEAVQLSKKLNEFRGTPQ